MEFNFSHSGNLNTTSGSISTGLRSGLQESIEEIERQTSIIVLQGT